MRRSDREMTDPSLIEEFIAGEKIIRIAFFDEGDIYIVPVNYGYTCADGRYTFYFHGAKAGRKYGLAKAGPNVGFEIDGRYELMPAETACDHSAHFMSVIGTGRLTLIEDRAAKTAALTAVMKQNTGRTEWSFDEKMLEATAVFMLEADKLSCKAK